MLSAVLNQRHPPDMAAIYETKPCLDRSGMDTDRRSDRHYKAAQRGTSYDVPTGTTAHCWWTGHCSCGLRLAVPMHMAHTAGKQVWQRRQLETDDDI